MQYFEMIVESFINGQYSQAVSQFKALPFKERVSLLKSLTNGYWQHGLEQRQIDKLFENI